MHVAALRVLRCVLLAAVPERGPGTDVAPADVRAYNRAPRGLLHHRVVDRFGRAGIEGCGIEPQEVEVASCRRQCFLGAFENVAAKSGELLEIALRGEDEHAAVPQESSRTNIFLRSFNVGFFHETADAKPVFLPGQRFAELDVPITRLWPCGLNAESRQQITSRSPRGSKRGFAEGRYVGYRMIGGQHKEQAVRIGMAHM